MKRLHTFYFALLMLLMVFLSIETGWAQQATFNFMGNAQSFVVPAGVISIHIEAWGAEGATVVTTTTGVGGLGGMAEGDLAVTPGQTLDIFVGGQGCVQLAGIGCGGFNGGGNAGGTGRFTVLQRRLRQHQRSALRLLRRFGRRIRDQHFEQRVVFLYEYRPPA